MRSGAAPSVGFVVFSVSALFSVILCRQDVGFGDAGELGGAAAVLGVPHPTGFPIDMLVLHAATKLLPFGTLALRQNLVTAWIAAAVLGALAELVVRLCRGAGVGTWPGVLAGGVTLALWPTFAASALAVEVYSTALLGVSLATLAWFGGRAGTSRLALLVGLAAGLHVSVAPIAIALFAACILRMPRQRRLRAVAVRGPLVAVGGGVLAYLPLASFRDPAFDWGNPESFAALWAHLSGARIRSAYADRMLGGGQDAIGMLTAQLSELWPILPLSALGLWLLWRRRRKASLILSGLLVFDLAYAIWINPMGVVDRQVGHLAGAMVCVLGAVGLSLVATRLPRRGGQALQWATCAAIVVAAVVRDTGEARADGHLVDELYGGGGVMSATPARTLLVCFADDSCAAALFSRYAEGARPDLDVVPAQHLWDPLLARRAGLRAEEAPPNARGRAWVAVRAVGELARPDFPRPVLWTAIQPLRQVEAQASTRVSRWPPLLRVGAVEDDPRTCFEVLEAALEARTSPTGRRGRAAWSEAFDTAGQRWLAAGQVTLAVVALRRATEIAPHRAVAWSNLGVALQVGGDVPAAMEATRRAITLAPERPTPWVNLVRMHLELLGDADAARAALALSREAGVEDSRLDKLEARLSSQR